MDSIFIRYASALFDIAKEENKINEYKQSIKQIDEFLSTEVNLKFLESYFVDDNKKNGFIDELCKPYKLSNLNNFLKLLVKKHKIHNFSKISYEFIKLCNANLGVLEGYVYSVNLLTKEKIEEIEKSIGKKLNSQVELVNLIDETLVGGIKVVVHDHVFDGSIKNKLQALRTSLNERRS